MALVHHISTDQDPSCSCWLQSAIKEGRELANLDGGFTSTMVNMAALNSLQANHFRGELVCLCRLCQGLCLAKSADVLP